MSHLRSLVNKIMKAQQIKEKINERYGKIALAGNSESCCASTECKNENSIN
ncbi:MAG: hypothetical protein WAM14_05250 [Candidatus Nitrosopolaris sp.]